MGLDNGIFIKNKYKELYDELGPDCWPELDHGDCKYEICYWRKCWGIRNAIMKKFHFEDGEYEFKLDKEDIPVIIKILLHFCNNDVWEDEGNPIWSYDEIIETNINYIVALKQLIKYWDKHPDLEVYFYDSY